MPSKRARPFSLFSSFPSFPLLRAPAPSLTRGRIASLKPALACFCHCDSCQTYGGDAANVGAWSPDQFKITKGDDNLLRYESSPGKLRVSCKTCGSWAYNQLPNGLIVVPLGALKYLENTERVKPTCHIFYVDRRVDANDDLPKFDGWPPQQ